MRDSIGPLTRFLGLALGVWSAIDTSLDDLVFALELVLEFVLKLAHIVGLLVDVHRVWPATALERARQRLFICASFGHFVGSWSGENGGVPWSQFLTAQILNFSVGHCSTPHNVAYPFGVWCCGAVTCGVHSWSVDKSSNGLTGV